MITKGEKLEAVRKQLLLLYDLFSEEDGPPNLSPQGVEGLCWWFESLSDQVGEIDEMLGKGISQPLTEQKAAQNASITH